MMRSKNLENTAMYALVEIKGKQYRVEKDSVVRVDHIDSEEGTAVEFPTVMLVKDEKSTRVGLPTSMAPSSRAKSPRRREIAR
jgi:ribosomal protein L21